MPGWWQDPQTHLRASASGRSAQAYRDIVDFVGKDMMEETVVVFNKMSQQYRRESTRAIAVSSRDDFRYYVHKVLDDIEEAESVGNMRSVTKLTRILARKDRRTSCNPSKGADGRLITTTAQLLSGWEKYLGANFQRPTTDADRNLENLVAEEDVLGYDELEVCLKALRSGKATGCDNVPVEAYRGSVHATNELFRIMSHAAALGAYPSRTGAWDIHHPAQEGLP